MELLFICTGNTCRSPMAAGILSELAKARALPVHASSAGLMAFTSAPAERHAVNAAAFYGADLTEHRARRTETALMAGADLIVCMTEAHRAYLTEHYPQFAAKIRLLPGGEVPDPFGQDADMYKKTAARLTQALGTLLDELFPAQGADV